MALEKDRASLAMMFTTAECNLVSEIIIKYATNSFNITAVA